MTEPVVPNSGDAPPPGPAAGPDFSEVFALCAHGIAVSEAGGDRVISCNPAFARMLGRPAADVVGRLVFDLYIPSVRDQIRTWIRQAHRDGSVSFEAEMLRADGSAFPVEVGLVCVRDARGGITHRVASIKDLSLRRRAEDASRINERKFSAIFRSSGTATCVTSLADGRIEDVNEAFLQLFDFRREAVIGRTTVELNCWADLRQREEFLQALRANRPVVAREVQYRRQSGAIRHGLLSSEVIEAEGRKVILTTLADISARKESEAILHLQRRLALGLSRTASVIEGLTLCLEAALQSAGLDAGGFYLFDDQGGIELVVHRGLAAPFIAAARHYPAGSEQVRLISRGQPVYTNFSQLGIPQPPEFTAEGLHFFATIPFRAEHGVIGCLNVASHTVTEISAAARETLETIAVDASQAIARLRTEEALQRERIRLNNVIEGTGVAVWEWNVQTGRTVFNERWSRMLGYEPAELAPTSVETWEHLMHPDDLERARGLLRRHFAGELPHLDLECRLRHRDGHWVWVLDRGRLVARTPEGEPLLMLGTHAEITASKEAALALEESERNYREIFNATDDAIFLHDAETGQVLDVNAAMLRLFGFASREEYFAAPPDCTFVTEPGFDPATAMRHLQRAVTDGPQVFPWRARRCDGRTFWVEVSLRSARIAGRRCILAVVRDTTTRKAAEDALWENEERYRHLVESSFDWVWEVDTQGRYTYASPRSRELLGYEPAEMVGRSAFEFMPPAEAERLSAIFSRLAASRAPLVALENACVHRDGHQVIVETNGVPRFSSDGEWLGYRGMDRDVTARRTAERRLRLHGAALEAAANAIVITDHAGRIEWANRAFVDLSGWSLEEAVGRTPGELLNSGKHDAAFFERMWATILAGRVWHGEIVNRRKDGGHRTEQMDITPITDERGVITHFIAIKQDITQQKALEAASRQTQRMEAIGTLASGVAHDLNNILSPITMVTGLLRTKLPDEQDREILAMVHQNAMRGANIIRQLLTFSRGVEGQRMPVPPRHLLKEIMALMRETFPREINLHLECPNSLGAVLADPTQLHQVILNLCVNARDAMPGGGHLSLRASNEILQASDTRLPAGVEPGAFVVLEVKDTGHGIPAEIQHRVFDPFFTTKPLGKGTGLGLSTVLGIVRSHGGFITIDSAPDRGACFRVYLPSVPADDTVTEASPPHLGSAGRGRVILVVEDERNIRETLRLILENTGYRVLLAVNGQDALAQFSERPESIALVLTDVMMPVMSGIALVKAIRATGSDVPVIVSSGLKEVSARDELAALGVPEVLAKPYEESALLEAIERKLHHA